MNVGNVGEIVERVGNEIAYAPDLAAYKRDVRAVLNEVYQELAAAHEWPWLKRRAPFLALPDVNIPNAGLVRVNDRFFTLNASVQFLDTLYPSEDAEAFLTIQPHIEGGEFGVDRTRRDTGDGNWELGPFIIERITSSATAVTLQLDPRCVCNSIVGDEEEWALRFPRQRMPPDCDQVLGIFDEDERPLIAMSPEEAKSRWLQVQESGATARPTHFLTDEGFLARFPQLVSPLHSTATYDALSPDIYSRSNIPVRDDPPFIAAAGVGGSLKASTRYRLFCCWYYAGRFGPPSAIVEVSTTAANRLINLTAIPVLTSTEYGRNLAFFMAEGDTGSFILEGFQLVQTAATRTIAVRADGTTKPWGTVRWDECYPRGPYTYVRLWPRTDAFREMRVLYLAKPRMLVENGDEPEFDTKFRTYLVWQTCVVMANRHGSTAQVERWRAEAARWFDRLLARYRPEARYTPQKGQLGYGSHPPPFPFKGVTYLG